MRARLAARRREAELEEEEEMAVEDEDDDDDKPGAGSDEEGSSSWWGRVLLPTVGSTQKVEVKTWLRFFLFFARRSVYHHMPV